MLTHITHDAKGMFVAITALHTWLHLAAHKEIELQTF